MKDYGGWHRVILGGVRAGETWPGIDTKSSRLVGKVSGDLPVPW